jgi:transposase
MAAQGCWFADLLHRDGAMGELEYIRWQNFERRVKRWEQIKLMKENK